MLYRFAINQRNQIVDIQDLSHEDRNTLHLCVGCSERLIPKMGKVREWHFAHHFDQNCHFEHKVYG